MPKGNKHIVLNTNSSNNNLPYVQTSLPNLPILPSKSVPGLANYEQLIQNVVLSLSNGGQIFEHVWLKRKKARLFQQGDHNFQQLPSEERKNILINGTPTVELDFQSLHPNMLLNLNGKACAKVDIYSRILKELGIRKTKATRKALKIIMLIAINIDSTHSFSRYVNQTEFTKGKLKGQRIMDYLPVRPVDIYRAIIRAFPVLTPYICTGKYALQLQMKDSKIMIDILETLATQGIVALPVHDSVICPAQHEDFLRQVMIEEYQKVMGFEPIVD